MRPKRPPTPSQVSRALADAAVLWRPPDPEKENAQVGANHQGTDAALLSTTALRSLARSGVDPQGERRQRGRS